MHEPENDVENHNSNDDFSHSLGVVFAVSEGFPRIRNGTTSRSQVGFLCLLDPDLSFYIRNGLARLWLSYGPGEHHFPNHRVHHPLSAVGRPAPPVRDGIVSVQARRS